MKSQDEYFDEMERKEEEKYEKEMKNHLNNDSYNYGGGYEASKGDFEGACLARAEYDAGHFS